MVTKFAVDTEFGEVVTNAVDNCRLWKDIDQ